MSTLSLRQAWRQRWRRWLDKRIPARTEQVLNHRNIFIFPTGFGAFYLLVTVLLFTIGLIYQNNSVYAFCFFLVAVFVAAIMPTYQNLQGLRCRVSSSSTTIAGGPFDVKLHVSAAGVDRFQLIFRHESEVVLTLYSVESKPVHLGMLYAQPGVFPLPLVKLASVYPLGFFRAWTWLSLEHLIYVAPKPKQYSEIEQLISARGERSIAFRQDDDELELREYRHGDSARDIYWRKAAAGGQLLSKARVLQHSSEAPQGLLDYRLSQAPSHVLKLADLCYWVLRCEHLGQPYGLMLPDTVVAMDCGDVQKNRCLQALAEAL